MGRTVQVEGSRSGDVAVSVDRHERTPLREVWLRVYVPGASVSLALTPELARELAATLDHQADVVDAQTRIVLRTAGDAS